MDKKINLAEVAEMAGVSTATVSRVLNDYPFVREETREKVLKVINATNYRVNAVARNLRRKRTHSIGVIVSNVLSPFYAVIAKSVEDVAIRSGFRTILCNGGDSPEKELSYLKMLHENRVDGVILSPTGENGDFLLYLLSIGIPVICVDRTVERVPCDTVMVNNREASRSAVNFLFDRQYRSIGFISGPMDRLTGRERFAGYREAVIAHGFAIDESLTAFGDFSYESGEFIASNMIGNAGVDCIYAANTDMGMGAFHALMERGVRVPGDMGFIMFDDPDWTTLVTPRVTAVRQPVYSIGATATDMLVRRIAKGGDSVNSEPVHVSLEAKLMVRSSA